MRLPVERFVLSALVPTLTDYGPFTPQHDRAAAAGYLRCYQRARRRSWQERGISERVGIHLDPLHLPFDPVSYSLLASSSRQFTYSQQLRYFDAGGPVQRFVLETMCRLRMLGQEQVEAILDATEREGVPVVAEAGGWMAREGLSNGNAAFIPYYCWGLQEILDVRFAYGAFRVANGADRYVERIGAFPLGEVFTSDYFGASVRLMGFRAHEVVSKHRPFVDQAVELLRENVTVCLGQKPTDSIPVRELAQVTHIQPGGHVVGM